MKLSYRMPSTIYTTAIAMASSRPMLRRESWNVFAVPVKLVCTRAGSVESASS
jgi:hypothetical protein